MGEGEDVLRDVLEAVPGSIRELARETGVSEGLLRAVRDETRQLTPDTRDRLVAALRRWESRCGDAADALEAANLKIGGNDG